MTAQRPLMRNGTVVTMDPALGDFARADVLVSDDRIEAAQPELADVDTEVIDAVLTTSEP